MEEIILNCICNDIILHNHSYIDKENIIKCSNCEFYQHKNCISPMDESEIYICPICQFTLYDPFLRIKYHFLIPEIIRNNEYGLMTYKFNLKNDIFNMDPPDKKCFLILRCLKLSKDSFCLEWPDKIDLYINNNEKKIYSVNQTFDKFNKVINEQITFPIFNNEKKITHFTKYIGNAFDFFKLNEENEIKINFIKPEKKNYNKYIITLDYVQYINNIDDIMKEVKFIDDTNELIKLTKSYNIIGEKINFLDPISKKNIIEVPARGIKCEHIPCFDLKNFFIKQNENLEISCPICKKRVGLIYIDGFILQLIESFKENYNAVQMNGKYEIIMLIGKEKYLNNNNNENNKSNDVIYLDDSCIDVNYSLIEKNIKMRKPIFRVLNNGFDKNNIKKMRFLVHK